MKAFVQFLDQLLGLVLNVALVGALVFACGSTYIAYQRSIKVFPPTVAQRSYAQHFCVDEHHGVVTRVAVITPDLFHVSASVPRMSIRCSFGSIGYMLQTVDLASVSAPPVQ